MTSLKSGSRVPTVNVWQRFSFAIAMDKSNVMKCHDVTGAAKIVKSFVPGLIPFSEFKLEFLNNLITVSIWQRAVLSGLA